MVVGVKQHECLIDRVDRAAQQLRAALYLGFGLLTLGKVGNYRNCANELAVALAWRGGNGHRHGTAIRTMQSHIVGARPSRPTLSALVRLECVVFGNSSVTYMFTNKICRFT